MLGLCFFGSIADAKLLSQSKYCSFAFRVEDVYTSKVFHRGLIPNYSVDYVEMALVVIVSTDTQYDMPKFSFSSDKYKNLPLLGNRSTSDYSESGWIDPFQHDGEYAYLGEKNDRHLYLLAIRDPFERWVQWESYPTKNPGPRKPYEFTLGLREHASTCANVRGIN